MRKLAYVGMALLVLMCLSIPVWAQKGGHE